MARPRKDAAEGSALNPTKAPEALSKVEAKLAALPQSAVLAVEGDVAATVNAVLAALPRLRGLEDQLAAELPKHPKGEIEALDELAHAAWFADVVSSHTSGTGSSKTLLDEAKHLRDGLLIAAEALAHRGLFDRDTVAKIRATSGGSPSELAKDVADLAALFTKEWAQVGAKTAVEKKEVERASKLGPELLFAAAAGAQADKGGTDPKETRARAYTLLVQTYESVRRAVAYLRWNEGDADTFAPAFPKKRGPRKGKGEAGEANDAGEGAGSGALANGASHDDLADEGDGANA